MAAAEKLTVEKSLEALLEVRKRVEAAYARGGKTVKLNLKPGKTTRIQVGDGGAEILAGAPGES